MGKPELRKQVLQLVQSLGELEKQRQSAMVVRQVLAHPKYKSSTALSVYLSTANEIDTKPILQHALQVDRKSCYIPLIANQSGRTNEPRMVMTRLESMAHYENLPLNRYGIREPKGESSMDEDRLLKPCKLTGGSQVLIIVPGVAFARDGRRLGQGKGYYDEFLHYWSSRYSTGFYTLGLAFLEQLVEDPCANESHDYRLSQVMTAV